MRTGAARMHDTLGDALVVEVGDLLPQDEVFQQRRPAVVRAQRILVVADRDALVGGQRRMLAAGAEMEFAAGAARRVTALVARDKRLLRLPLALPEKSTTWRLAPTDSSTEAPTWPGR